MERRHVNPAIGVCGMFCFVRDIEETDGANVFSSFAAGEIKAVVKVYLPVADNTCKLYRARKRC